VSETFYLVTYEWRECGRHSSNAFRRENEAIKGCPAIWWATKLRWYYLHEEKGREAAQRYAERGEQVPLSEVVNETDLAFIGAVPITEEGFDLIERGRSYDEDEDNEED